MALFVNTNVASLNAQRALGKSAGEHQRSFQRLASGVGSKTVEGESGLDISTRLQAQISGMNSAVRKTNDGISLTQTVEGALSETSAILDRMHALTLQAADGTTTRRERDSIQTKVDALIDEIDRIAGTTTFNQQKVLTGGFSGAHFHVGSGDAKETIRVNIKDTRADALGQRALYEGANAVPVRGEEQRLQNGDVVINGMAIRETVAQDDSVSTVDNAGSAVAKAAAINDAAEHTGVKATALPTVLTGTDAVAATDLDGDSALSINGVEVSGFQVEENDASEILVSQINALSEETGVVARLDDDNRLVLEATDGRNIEVAVSGSATKLGVLAAAGSQVAGGQVALESDESFSLTGVGLEKLGHADEEHADGVFVEAEGALSRMDVSRPRGAQVALESVQVALEQVASMRTELGDIQSRMQSSIRTLQSGSENLSAAKARIGNTNIAGETADLARLQIVEQAGVSILSQSNQSAMNVLSLIGG